MEDSGPPTPAARALFSFGDTTILSSLDDLLAPRLSEAERGQLLDELRDRLYAGIGSEDVRQLHTAMVNRRDAPAEVILPHWNVKDPMVAFVSSWPPRGGEDTDLFVSKLKAAGFSSAQCVWTSLRRTSHTEDTIERWTPYLYGELRIWRPRLIIALGLEAASELLGDPGLRFKDVAGAVVWVGPWPILCTYSPAYATKSQKEQDFGADLAKAHHFCYGN